MACLKKLSLVPLFKNNFNSFITCACRRDVLHFCMPFFHPHHRFFSFVGKYREEKYFSLNLDTKSLIHEDRAFALMEVVALTNQIL